MMQQPETRHSSQLQNKDADDFPIYCSSSSEDGDLGGWNDLGDHEKDYDDDKEEEEEHDDNGGAVGCGEGGRGQSYDDQRSAVLEPSRQCNQSGEYTVVSTTAIAASIGD